MNIEFVMCCRNEYLVSLWSKSNAQLLFAFHYYYDNQEATSIWTTHTGVQPYSLNTVCISLFFFYNLNSFISVISINKILSYYSCNVNVGSFPDLVRINFSRNSLILYSLIMLSSPHVQISLSLRQDAQLKKMESQYSVFIYVVIHGTQISGLSDVKLSAFAEFVL